MRRLVALFVIALAGATWFGLSSASTGLSVNHQEVSASTLRAELGAIAHDNTLQCFITALNPTNFAPGAGGDSISAAGAAAWANLRVEGLVIDQYVTSHFKYHPDAQQLAQATSSIQGEMTQQASANSLTCPGTSAQALDAMPSEMRRALVRAQAASLYLVGSLREAIPLTVASMRSYYAAHTSQYDTLCVSIALVPTSEVSAFAKSESAGLSVAQLAAKYSQDASASTGGAYGCYAPTNASYASVRADASSPTLDTFPATPVYVRVSTGVDALYVAVTKRSPTTFNEAAPVVLADLRSLNAASANSVKNTLLYAAAVHVDPAIGRWGLSANGPSVFAPATPAASDVLGSRQLTGTGTTTYK